MCMLHNVFLLLIGFLSAFLLCLFVRAVGRSHGKDLSNLPGLYSDEEEEKEEESVEEEGLCGFVMLCHRYRSETSQRTLPKLQQIYLTEFAVRNGQFLLCLTVSLV